MTAIMTHAHSLHPSLLGRARAGGDVVGGREGGGLVCVFCVQQICLDY